MEILVGLAMVCVIWSVTASVMIAIDLEERGLSVHFIWLRVLLLKYLHQYSKITREETGRVGPLFYHYIVPINIALVLAVVMLILSLA